jgi:hypothetical protein
MYSKQQLLKAENTSNFLIWFSCFKGIYIPSASFKKLATPIRNIISSYTEKIAAISMIITITTR